MMNANQRRPTSRPQDWHSMRSVQRLRDEVPITDRLSIGTSQNTRSGKKWYGDDEKEIGNLSRVGRPRLFYASQLAGIPTDCQRFPLSKVELRFGGGNANRRKTESALTTRWAVAARPRRPITTVSNHRRVCGQHHASLISRSRPNMIRASVTWPTRADGRVGSDEQGPSPRRS